MDQAYLYHPFVPVLLGRHRTAAQVASRIWQHHGVKCHYFAQARGRGWHGFMRRHPLPAPLSPTSDEAITRALLDFAKVMEQSGGFLSLIPCSPEAEAYLHRTRSVLESSFVLLPPSSPSGDPLKGLIAPLQ